MKIDLRALGYNPMSPGATELIKIFQEGIDDVKKYRSMSFTDRKKKIANYIRKTLFPKFKKTVLKHYGMDCKLVHTTDANYPDPLMIAMLPMVGSADRTWEITTVMLGDGRITGVETNPTTAKELINLANSINQNTHKLNYDNVGKSIPIYFEIFIPNGIFILNDYTGNQIVNFTAEELAAAYLHEIGHQMILVEKCNRTIAHSRILEEAVNVFNRDATIKERAEMVKYMFHKRDMDDAITDMKNQQDAELVVTVPSKVVDVIKTFIYTCFILFINYCPAFFVTRILMNELIEILILGTKQIGKTSDKVATYTENVSEELGADEFVSRNGMGSHLAEALIHLKEVDRVTRFTGYSNNALSNLLISIPYYFMCIDGTLTGKKWSCVYEDDFDRMERLVKNSFDNLKNGNLPKHIENFTIKEAERTMAERSKLRKNYAFEHKFKIIIQFMRDHMNILMLVRTLANGNYIEQYNKLESKIEGLHSSKLWYQAAKLKSFIK